MLNLSSSDLWTLLTGSVLSGLSILVSSHDGVTAASIVVTIIFVLFALTRPVEQQLYLIALALPNTRTLEIGTVSGAICICSLVPILHFGNIKNRLSILPIVLIYLIYSTEFIVRFDDISIGFIMPVKMALNILFFLYLSGNESIISNPIGNALKSALFLSIGIVTALASTYYIGDAFSETGRMSVEGNDPNMLAVESAFCISIFSVGYFRKWITFKVFAVFTSFLFVSSALCGSRMGILLIGLVLLVSWIFNTRNIKSSILFLGALAIVAILIVKSNSGQQILDNLLTRTEGRDDISNGRFELWATYMKKFSDSELLLWGMGKFENYNIPMMAHNFLLEDLCDYGLIGLMMLYICYIKIYQKLFNAVKLQYGYTLDIYMLLPFFIPIVGGLTLHGLTSIINTMMLFIGVLVLSSSTTIYREE